MVKSVPHVHLVSYVYPGEGTGTAIVLQRHLSRLSDDGWHVTVSAPFSARSSITGLHEKWKVLELPARQWWWPPFRDGYPSLEKLRSRLSGRYLAKRTASSPPEYVLSHAHHFYPCIAYEYAQLVRARFVLIIHDRDEVWAKSNRFAKHAEMRVRRLVQRADKVLAVTQELLDWYETPPNKGIVLPPIPGSVIYKPRWCERRRREFKVFHAGSLNLPQEEVISDFALRLNKLGGNLVLIAPEYDTIAHRLVGRHANVNRMPLFERNEDAVRFVADEALAFLAVYSFDEHAQPWLKTSFPSKVLDFMRSGVPGIILAPKSAAVTKWATKVEWPALCTEPNDGSLEILITSLQNRRWWKHASQVSSSLATGNCSAARTHATFVTGLSSM